MTRSTTPPNSCDLHLDNPHPASGATLKSLAPVHRFTALFFDVEKHPVQAVGIVAGALVTVRSSIGSLVRALGLNQQEEAMLPRQFTGLTCNTIGTVQDAVADHLPSEPRCVRRAQVTPTTNRLALVA
jgi:hypothetical protein